MGGITGTVIYAEIYPLLKNSILQGTMFKSFTISQMLGVNNWIVIIMLSAMIFAIFYMVKILERKRYYE